MDNSVIFNEKDIDLLYIVPRPGSDILYIVRVYTFVHRTFPPAYMEIQMCFTKALQTGIMQEEKGKYKIVPEWYEHIHAHDATAANEIESLLEFAEEFVGTELPIIVDKKFIVTEEQYNLLLKKLADKNW